MDLQLMPRSFPDGARCASPTLTTAQPVHKVNGLVELVRNMSDLSGMISSGPMVQFGNVGHLIKVLQLKPLGLKALLTSSTGLSWKNLNLKMKKKKTSCVLI